MPRSRLPLLLLCIAAACAGCGQSGPLYLPGSPSQMTTLPPAPEDSAGGEEEDDDNNGDGRE